MEIFGYILVFLAAMLCWAVGIALTSFALSEMKTDKNLWDKMISDDLYRLTSIQYMVQSGLKYPFNLRYIDYA